MSEQQFTDEDRKAASYCREAAEANPKGSRGEVAEAAFLAGIHYARNLARQPEPTCKHSVLPGGVGCVVCEAEALESKCRRP